MLSQNGAIWALYSDKDHMSQNSACRKIVLSQNSAGTDSSIPNGHLPVSPHGAQFDVNLFTPSFLCINEKWTFSTGSFAIFCPDEKLPSGRAVMKFVIAMNLTSKATHGCWLRLLNYQSTQILCEAITKVDWLMLASVTRLLKKRWTLARLNLILHFKTR